MKPPGLAELHAIAAVAARKSFRGAAAELGLSPSALSHAVAALEQRLGVRLFQRTTRSVALTAAGERFLGRVGPALREIGEAMAAAREESDAITGTLRINTSEAAARLVLMPMVLAFIARHPGVSVDLVTDDAFVDIVADGFDAGVRGKDDVPADMVAVPCSDDVGYAVVAAPSVWKRRSLPAVPADLLQHDCIRRRWSSGALYRWEFEKRGRAITVDVRGTLTFDRDDLMLAAARAGAGVAYLDEWSVADDLASGRLVRVLADWTPRYPGLAVYYPGGRHLPARLRAFLEVVRGRPGGSPRFSRQRR